MAAPRVCLGVITGAHGVRGQVRIKPFTEEPESLAAYGPLCDEAGRRRFRVSLTGRSKDQLLARIEGVTDRDAAAALKGTRLFVERDALPPPEDAETFYHVDLIGLAAEDTRGRPLGRVAAVQDFGAGVLLEVAPEVGPAVFYPFTRTVVPEVDIAGGRLIIDPPPESPAEAGGGSGQSGREGP